MKLSALVTVFALVLLGTRQARAQDTAHQLAPWATTDTALEGAFALSVAADLSTSINQAPRIYERNPILDAASHSRHPSHAAYFLYDATAVGLHFGISRILPQPYRAFWQGASLGVEVGTVGENLKLGAQFRF